MQGKALSSSVATEWNDALYWDADLIRKYDVAGPRYTSYPTAVQFSERFAAADYESYLRERPATIGPLSLYVHIPFCRNICYYCACNKIVTRDGEAAERYLLAVERELAMLARHFDRRRRVTQLHWGGGTPTFLSNSELTRLLHGIACHFSLIDTPEREYSIEIDPRTVNEETIALLKGLGFNRISMGIQDFDPDVQRAVNRVQDFAQVQRLVQAVRTYRFASLSFDLIYGLPRQSVRSIGRTLEQVIELSPDRISCYGYAHMPTLFSSQRSIDRLTVPDAAERLQILQTIVTTLCGAGYIYVGLDHFVKPHDELARALHCGNLQRNFQGYSTQMAPELLGVGVSAISSNGDIHSQNAKTIDEYYAAIDGGHLPTQRGLQLDDEDRLRRDVIMDLLCRMHVDIAQIEQRHGIVFGEHFAPELERLAEMESDGLVARDSRSIHVTAYGRPLVRNICMVFDAYQTQATARHSRTI